MVIRALAEGMPPLRAAIFMSGSGSNAERLLESLASGAANSWKAAAIVTDRPETSKASDIAERNGLPLVALDIAEFYRAKGLKRVSLATQEGRDAREAWTDKLRSMLNPLSIDFGLLAGFVPLSNIAGDFPCLNVHPGDLTVEQDGVRILAGLHTVPIERAIMEGHTQLRSSVIVAQPYTGAASSDMDSGPILGVSAPVSIDFMDMDMDTLRRTAEMRPESRPPGGFKDSLEELASHNQGLLKVSGDWTVFPPAVESFASGRYAIDDAGGLLWRKSSSEWTPVKTVEFKTWEGIPVER